MSAPTYFKRYRMERDLRDLPPVPDLPPEFEWAGWAGALTRGGITGYATPDTICTTTPAAATISAVTVTRSIDSRGVRLCIMHLRAFWQAQL